MTLPENATFTSNVDRPVSVTGRFRKRPTEVTATRWWSNGDHPDDGIDPESTDWVEGAVVRYYRHPEDPETRECVHCGFIMRDHGWIETLEGGFIVCPGDWIVTGVAGERYPVKPDIFDVTYEPVAE